MRVPFSIPILVTVTAILLGGVAVMAIADVEISKNRSKRCIVSDGLPNHDTGTFPNRNNPNRISAQDISVCVTANPKKGNTPQDIRVPGIAINGVKIRPGTADFYDASTPRGHSRNPRSGWNLDGMGARAVLGLDIQNAHVGPEGDYHYHGMPPALANTSISTLMGYAADGFEIHYVGSNARSSYMLLPGARATAPGGAHDGTYNEDWTFVSGAGNLDECNGGISDGTYKYFATDTYPFFPRCLFGTEITQMR
ncbi:MAG: YHYH protein [Sulfitobacter sp.]